jgi:hypothetical protein
VHAAAVAVWARKTGIAVVSIAIEMALAIRTLVETFTGVTSCDKGVNAGHLWLRWAMKESFGVNPDFALLGR